MLDLRRVSTVLLDMDGTLLDLHFDNHFWRQHVPQRYAEANGLSHAAACTELDARYAARVGTLAWYSVDHWRAELGLDIMALKLELAHLIAVHPHVTEFLKHARALDRRVLLVTNAHQESLRLKMDRSGLAPYFDALITSHEIGLPKEDPCFWQRLQTHVAFNPETTLLIDDSLPVLDSAKNFGMGHLLAMAKPDSQLPPQDTREYQAITSFHECIVSREQAIDHLGGEQREKPPEQSL
jgi:putative hydrolase of the HAD superfamily